MGGDKVQRPQVGPLAEVLEEYFAERVADDITRRVNTAARDVHAEWRTRPNRDAYVDQAIREAAYRAVHDVLAQDYVTVRAVVRVTSVETSSAPGRRRGG